jgi:hypothetical protein
MLPPFEFDPTVHPKSLLAGRWIEAGAARAHRIGELREQHCRRRKARHTGGWMSTVGSSALYDPKAAVAEWFHAVTLKRAWLSCGLAPDSGPDVDGGIQVRWTATRNPTRLFVYPRDAAEWYFALYTSPAPVCITLGLYWPMLFVGWIDGASARRPEYWREPPAVKEAAWVIESPQLSKDLHALDAATRALMQFPHTDLWLYPLP